MAKTSREKRQKAAARKRLKDIKDSGCTEVEYVLWEILLLYLLLADPDFFPEIANPGPRIVKKLYPGYTQEELECTSWGIKIALFSLYMKNDKFPQDSVKKLVFKGPRPGKPK